MISYSSFFQNFHLIYMPDIELSSCYKAGIMNNHKGQKLITIDSDSRGMAIQVNLGRILLLIQH